MLIPCQHPSISLGPPQIISFPFRNEDLGASTAIMRPHLAHLRRNFIELTPYESLLIPFRQTSSDSPQNTSLLLLEQLFFDPVCLFFKNISLYLLNEWTYI